MTRRVLCITSNFPRWPGDSTTPFVLHLAKDLQKLGWQIDVLAPHAPGAKKEEIIEGVHVKRFQYSWPETAQTVCYQGGALVNLRKNPLNKLKLPILVGAELIAVLKALKKHDYDLLHSHWILPQGFVGAIASSMLKTPHLITVHGGDVFGLSGRLMDLLKKTSLVKAHKITVNSSFTENAVKKIIENDSKIECIPMGATKPEPPPIEITQQIKRSLCPNSENLLAFTGRLVEEKGVADFISSIKILKENGLAVKGLVIGEGQDKEKFIAQSEELGLSSDIIFTGWMNHDQLLSHLAASDVFIGPSKTAKDGWVEAQGLTFIEAIFCRTPVVATRSGGIVDTIVHEKTGLLVDENNPKQIAKAVEKLLYSPDLRKSLIHNAMEHANKGFTRDVSAKRFSSLYDQMLKERI